MEYSLKIPPSQLREYRDAYDYSVETDVRPYGAQAKSQGYLTPAQLYEICNWKSRRKAKLALSNSDSLVREITAFSFAAANEESRIGSLTLLSGVMFPTASVILHFCIDETYPILDFRAIWSLGIKQPKQYTFKFWKSYISICRDVAAENSLTVRELDMALWQYSSVHQATNNLSNLTGAKNAPSS